MSQVSQDCPEIRVTPVNPVLRELQDLRVSLDCLEIPVTQGLPALPAYRVPKDLRATPVFLPKLP